MTTDMCSVWAYEDIKKSGYLGERQSMYLSVFVEAYHYGHRKSLTAWQATQAIEDKFGKHFSKNGIGSRLSELVRMGFLVKDGIRYCQETKQKVNSWKYTGRKKPLAKKIESCPCPRCDGKGYIEREVYFEEEQRDLF